MKKVIVALLLAVMMLCGCTRESGSEEPLMYHDRMKYAGSNIYIDTETGVCYLYGHGYTVMVDHNGDPYIANGWRDWGGDE